MSKSKSHRRRERPVERKSAPSILNLWGLDQFLAANTIAGPVITPETAMQCTAVACAVSLIADTVGNLPAKLYVRDDKGGKLPDSDHPAYGLVHDDASADVSASALRTQLTTDALLHGNGYAFANRLEDGRVYDFTRLDPRAVTVHQDALSGEVSYRLSSGSAHRILARDEVLHIPAFSLDGIKGTSPVHLAREAIALSLIMEQHASRLFAAGGRPSGILTTPEDLGDDGVKNIAESWHAAHGGQQSGKTAILEKGMAFQPLAFNSVDSQFLEVRTHQLDEIARAFRVPPSMLFNLGRATWGNTEQMGALFLQLTLLPWLRTWQDAYRRLLLSEDERRTHLVEFVIDDLLRADAATRATAYAQYRAMGAMTKNEVRAGLNLPALDGGDDLDNPNITTAPAAQSAPEAEAA
ncbi:phage portal protein [Methylopila sp. 73B]|uniref:phage portal protein n=1 Tax=Methylopila sp. 73B TaxID=1120792 RepID=UPI00036ADD20|nr:phage portal protein [Methylopila sp. 73B]